MDQQNLSNDDKKHSARNTLQDKTVDEASSIIKSEALSEDSAMAF
jgi:hypothetical protein